MYYSILKSLVLYLNVKVFCRLYALQLFSSEDFSLFTSYYPIFFFWAQTVRKIYITHEREQSGVAERSDADDWLWSAVDVGFQSIFAETERIFLKNNLQSFFRIQIVRKIYITHGREQLGVAMQSDADDWLEAHFGSIAKYFYRKYRKYCYKTSHDDTLCTNIRVAGFIGE